MKTITQNLQKELKSALKSADEVWVAVALLTNQGLTFIQENLPKKAKEHYILGIDLPTEVKALKELDKQQYVSDVEVLMFAKQEFYHPKVYIVKSKGKYKAFVGSANTTRSGLFSNIELSFIVESQRACKELIVWFNGIKERASILTSTFISEYEESYKERLERKKQDEKEAKETKKELEKENDVIMSSREALIKKLKAYRNHKNYKEESKARWKDVKELRSSLDFPNFDKVDVDAFFENWALGHLISIPKPTLKEEKKRFKKLLQVLTDDTIDVAIRFNRAYEGDLYIKGVGVATISKILTLHNPDKYCVSNDKIADLLNEYGIELPQRISKGEKYKATNKFFIEICKETGIDDLAILDYYLYKEANE
ncbi:MAG: NgoFVII family restriction endonuclease [Altibacter sp.]|uniref:phospholipase D-like domain-containing protein n=1 Tax=Altibacter sp. TaxID=2024823 RepID=UPI001DC3E221|nr:phospholipase D-like domain-containing protein [Altibacter sp.]MBZ0328276.1 NgoFVII family restriction endonuclease [Altibacter sp.]